MIPAIKQTYFYGAGGTYYINTTDADTIIAIVQSKQSVDRIGVEAKIDGKNMTVAYEDLIASDGNQFIRVYNYNWFTPSSSTAFYINMGSTYVGVHVFVIKNGSSHVTFKGKHFVTSDSGANDCYSYSESDINIGDLMLGTTYAHYNGYSTDYPTLNYGWTKDTETVVAGGEIRERSHHMLVPSSGSSMFYECVSYGAFSIAVVHVQPRSGGLVLIFHEQ